MTSMQRPLFSLSLFLTKVKTLLQLDRDDGVSYYCTSSASASFWDEHCIMLYR